MVRGSSSLEFPTPREGGGIDEEGAHGWVWISYIILPTVYRLISLPRRRWLCEHYVVSCVCDVSHDERDPRPFHKIISCKIT